MYVGNLNGTMSDKDLLDHIRDIGVNHVTNMIQLNVRNNDHCSFCIRNLSSITLITGHNVRWFVYIKESVLTRNRAIILLVIMGIIMMILLATGGDRIVILRVRITIVLIRLNHCPKVGISLVVIRKKRLYRYYRFCQKY